MPQFALAMLMGALLAFYGNQLQDPFWSAYAPLLLLLARCNPKYRFVALLAAGLLWSSALLHDHLSHRLVADYDNRDLVLSGVIADIPQRHRDRISLLLDDLNIDGYPAKLPRRARFNWYQVEQLPLAGERWQFRVRIRQPRGLLNPAGFDFERWQFVQAIDAGGAIIDARDNRRLQAAPRFSLHRMRSGLAGSIERDCAQCRYAGLMKALVLGVRADIDPHARALLQSSGTAHLLAISGLHIGMVALFCFHLGRYGWRLGGYRSGINRRELASLCALIGALVYAALAGFSLPTLRALIMLAVVLAGLQLKRRINLLQSCAIALVVILALDPVAVGSSSFWLSFAALMVIAFASFRLPAKINGWRQLLLLQCFFALLFAPPGMIIFAQLNPASLPANLVAIPALSLLILPTVLAASLLSALHLGGATHLFALADGGLEYLFGFLEWLLASGLQSRETAGYPATLLLLALAAVVLLLLPRWSGLRSVAVAILAVLLCWQPARLRQGEYEMLVFDVGMGTSVLLRTRHHSLVYDFGPGRGPGFNAAELALLPVLQHYGIGTPDLLVASHVDQDHSGGLYAFVDNYAPSRLVSGTPVELRRRFRLAQRVRSCHGYADWRWDGVQFRFLQVSTPPASSTNNRSCILQIRGYHRALLPGDIERRQEDKLVAAYGPALAADILLAPHHGSRTSSSAPFVARVAAPQVAFTLSRYNRWGFPDATVTARYRKYAERLLRSDRDGAIRFTSRADGLEVATMRGPPRRIWRRW